MEEATLKLQGRDPGKQEPVEQKTNNLKQANQNDKAKQTPTWDGSAKFRSGDLNQDEQEERRGRRRRVEKTNLKWATHDEETEWRHEDEGEIEKTTRLRQQELHRERQGEYPPKQQIAEESDRNQRKKTSHNRTKGRRRSKRTTKKNKSQTDEAEHTRSIIKTT